MVALILYFALGPHAALVEIAAELMLGLVVLGGRGGRRLRRTFEQFVRLLRRRRVVLA